VEPLILLVVALGLGTYTFREQAPRQCDNAVRGLRASLVRLAGVPADSAVTGHSAMAARSDARGLTYFFVSRSYNRAVGLGAALLLAASPGRLMWSRDDHRADLSWLHSG